MKKCPCCSEQLLRHARYEGIYWFCTYCRQEMPDLSAIVTSRRERVQQLKRLMGDLVST